MTKLNGQRLMSRKDYDEKRKAGANACFIPVATLLNDSLIKDEYIDSLEEQVRYLTKRLYLADEQIKVKDELLEAYRAIYDEHKAKEENDK